MDGKKIPLADAPGNTPVKLAFRTGIKHVAAKNARPEKRVVIVNAVEATEAPESRRVSHVFVLISGTDPVFPPLLDRTRGSGPPIPAAHIDLGGCHHHPPHAPGTPPPPAHGIGSTLRNILLIVTPLASSCVSACRRTVRVG